MKRGIISLGLSAIMLSAAVPVAPMMTATVYAESEAPAQALDVLKYEIVDGKSVTITKCDDSVTEIDIPAKVNGLPVTYIGYGAFENCKALKSVTIPDTVTAIGEEAFHNCEALSFVVIPDSVTVIGAHAFGACASLKTLTVPLSVSKIDSLAFHNSKNLTIRCIAGSAAEEVAKDREIPYELIPSKSDEETSGQFKYIVVNGNSVTITGCDKSVTEIDIPAKIDGLPVTCISMLQNYAFLECRKLTSVTIPDSVKCIGMHAFHGCTSLKSINIPDSVTVIDSAAFYGCTSLESVTIPDGVTIIGDSAFSSCTSLKSFTIPDSVTELGIAAFQGCSSLESIVIPNSIHVICEDTFAGCENLTIYGYADSRAEDFAKEHDIPFVKNESEAEIEKTFGHLKYRVVDERNVTITKCDESVTEIEIPIQIVTPPVTKIGDGAFVNCTALTSVYIPYTVTSIGMSAFSNCKALNSVDLPSRLTTIGDEAFSCCSSLTAVTIPDSVTTIGMCAFSNCSSLTSVTIPESVTSMGSGDLHAFAGCDKLTIYGKAGSYAESFAKEHDIPFVLSETETKKLGSLEYKIVKGKSVEITKCDDSVTECEIPAEIEGLPVTQIGDEAFYACEELTSVTIPDSVTSIGAAAFVNCQKLTGITLPDSLTSIGKAAFNACESLTSVSIPDSVTSIGYKAFSACTHLVCVGMPNSITSIEPRVFAGCFALESINIPDSVTTIDVCAFENCSSLKSIIIPESVTTIDVSAFENCTSLESIIIPYSVTSIGTDAFDNCENLTIYGNAGSYAESFAKEHNIPFVLTGGLLDNGLKYEVIDGKSVKITDCDESVTEIEIPAEIKGLPVTQIGAFALADCGALRSVTIPEGVTSIDEHAFTFCGRLSCVVIPDSVTSIDLSIFEDCDGMEDYHQPTIHCNPGSYAETFAKEHGFSFAAMEEAERALGQLRYQKLGLKSVTITACDKSVTEIEIPTEIEGLPVTTLGGDAFNGCASLKSITIPDSVKRIEEGAFAYCTSLTSVILPKELDYIAIGIDSLPVFRGCTSLTSITIPDTITAFESDESTEERQMWLYRLFWVVFRNLALTSVNVHEDSQKFVSADNVLFNKDKTKLVLYFNGKQQQDYTIPDGVTSLCYGAFAECAALKSVTIPDSVTSIGEGAFADCTALESVTIPDSVTSIGDCAFSKCTALESVTIPDGVTCISDGAFAYCTALKSVTIPERVTSIGDSAFADCSALASFTIPDSVTSIGDSAFAGCSALASLTIPDSVTSIGKNAFSGADNFVIYGNAGSCAETYAKENAIPFALIGAAAEDTRTCGELKYEIINGTSIKIKECDKSVANVVRIPAEIEGLPVTAIGYGAFENCTEIRTVNIPETVAIIGEEAFHNCQKMTVVNIPVSVSIIGPHAFDSCASLHNLTIPESVTQIDQLAFHNCKNLTIHCVSGSAAEAVAKKREIPYELFMKGDANSDGSLNLKDVTLIRRYMVDSWSPATADARAAIDVNGDGSVNLKDVVILRRSIADGCTVDETIASIAYNKQALTDLSGVANARTLAGYVNTEGRTIKENAVFRTANLSHITDRAMTLLTEKYHVTDIVDFRYDRELNANTVDKEVPGTTYHNIAMSSTGDYANELFSKNPDLLAKFQELQRNVGKPGGKQALTFFQAEIGFFDTGRAIQYYESDEAAAKYKEMFDLFLAKKEGDAILFHCAGGKDRTGMVSMLLLAALDFDKKTMMQDYMMSNTANAEKIKEVKAAAAEYTDDPKVIYDIIYTEAVYEEVMSTIIDDLVRDYGSVKGFLREKVGLTDDDFAKLKELYLD